MKDHALQLHRFQVQALGKDSLSFSALFSFALSSLWLAHAQPAHAGVAPSTR